MVPSGVLIGSPPAKGLPSGAVWQAPQSAAIARYSPALDRGLVGGLIGLFGRMRNAGHDNADENDKQRADAMTGTAHDQPCLS